MRNRTPRDQPIPAVAKSATARAYNPFISTLLVAPLAVLLMGAFFYPIGRVLANSVWQSGFTLTYYQHIFTNALYLHVLVRTLRIALIVTLLTLVLGYPVAYVLTELKGWRATLVAACVLMPLWTSVLVRSYAWTVLLQRNGVVNSWLRGIGLIDEPLTLLYTEGAVLLAMTQVLLPFMILPIYSTMRGIPRDLVPASQSLGAGPFAAFRYVLLPLSLPGVAAGSVIVFVLALGFFITPALVGGPQTLLIATLIGQQVTELSNLPFASALAGTLMAIALILILAFNRVLRLNREGVA